MRDAIFCLRAARHAWARHCWAVVALGLLVVAGGCELGGQSEPQLSGPSDQGFNIELLALPDTLNADGISKSEVRLVVRNENGEPVTGYAVLFQHDGDGELKAAASSTYVGPVQTGEVLATDSNGMALVVYTAGTSFRTVAVSVRPYGFDASSFYFRSVFIYQR